MSLLLDDKSSGELFAAVPYTDPNAVEPAIDSSRFFAIRVVGEGGRKAVLGLGFEERSDAVDFSIALQDARKTLGWEKTPQTVGGGSAPGQIGGAGRGRRPAPPGASQQQQQVFQEPPEVKKDFRLKEGEMITVNIGGKGRRAAPSSSSLSSSGSQDLSMFALKPPPPPAGGRTGGGLPSLAPPPSARDVRGDSRASGQKVDPKDLGFDDGEFGEFQ